MEKIELNEEVKLDASNNVILSLKGLAKIINSINEIIDWVNEPDDVEDRLKTLEDKIEFVMKNSAGLKEVIRKSGSETLSHYETAPLQDLWDEQHWDRLEAIKKVYTQEVKDEPTVKECDCKCHRERGTVPHPEDDCDHKDNRYWNKMPPDPFMRVNKDDEIDLLDYKELNVQIYSGGALIKQQTIYCKEANIKYIEITAEPKNE